MKNLFNRFVADQSGATAIEYGLIAGLISIAVISAVKLVGVNLGNQFGKVANNLT